MRNLKRALSLALASVMLLGMMVVGTSAASYPDVDENDNVEAIEVLNAVNVMIGDRGNFRPDAAVNRHEMATIMAKLVLGVETADNYVGTHPFTDVFPWADKYVAACYENGLVAGTSATTFGGNQPLTAVQAAAMMLRALGYKDLSVGAKDWRAPVTAMANQIRLFDGVASNPSEQLTRNQVAQLALNTLKSPMVNLKDNTISWSNDEGQIIMTGGSREYIALSSNEAYAKAINDTEKAGTSASQIAGFTVELGEHLYNGKLKLNNNYLDVFGRPARHWEYDGKEIGSYIKEELMVMDNVGKVTGNDLYSLLGASTIKDYDTLVTIDGVANDRSDAKDILGYPNGAYFDEADMNRNNKAAVGKTGTGVLTQVFVDHEKDEVYVAVINTYLARADRDYDDKSEEATLTVYGIDEYRTEKEYVKDQGNSETMKVQAEDFTGLETIKKDDPFLVTVADGEIQTMVEDEVLEGVTLTAFKKGDHVVSDGTEYAYTTTATYDSATLDNYTGIDGKTNLKDISYNIYLDAYGNLIGIKEIDAVKNYVFLAGIDVDGSNLYSKTATANALFLDGTTKTIKINLAKSKWTTHPALNNTNVVISGDALLNTWCTYTVSSDNVYTVTEAYATRVNPDHPGLKDVTPKTINANPNNYPGGGENKTKLAQSWQPAAGLNEDNYTVDVKRMRLHGTTNNSDGSAYANVYGDSTSVYLTANLDELFNDQPDLNKGYNYGIIKDVDAVTTGVADVSIKVMTKKDAQDAADDAGKLTSRTVGDCAYGIYTLYDSDGIVIASVVIGEDDGVKDLVYVHTDTLDLESYNSTDDIWTWTRRVVFNGQETTLTEKDSELSELKEMLQFHWYEIKRNSDGNVISVVPAYSALYNASTEKNAFVHEYEMINTTVEATSKDTVLYQTEDGPLPADDNGAVTGHAHYGFYKEELDVIGTNTLAVETLTGSGIHFRDNVNVVLQYWNRNTEQTEIETGTGVDRLKSMVDFVNKNTETRDSAHPYYLSAVIEKGFATTIVIYDSFNSYNRPDAPAGNYELTLGGMLNSIYTTPAHLNSDVYIVNSDGSIDYVESNDSVATSTVNGYKRYTVPYGKTIRVYDNDVADADFQPFFSPIKPLSEYKYYENPTAKRAYFEFTVPVSIRLENDKLTIRERLSTDPVYVSIDSDAEATVTINGTTTTYKPGQSFTVTPGQTITVVPTTAGDKVYVNGELLGADGKYKVQPGDTELVITTKPGGVTPPDPDKKYYTVTFTENGAAEVKNFTTDVAEKYEENTAVKVTITANEGYELVSVGGEATEAGAKTAKWSIEKITANVTVEVVTKKTEDPKPETGLDVTITFGDKSVENGEWDIEIVSGSATAGTMLPKGAGLKTGDKFKFSPSFVLSVKEGDGADYENVNGEMVWTVTDTTMKVSTRNGGSWFAPGATWMYKTDDMKKPDFLWGDMEENFARWDPPAWVGAYKKGETVYTIVTLEDGRKAVLTLKNNDGIDFGIDEELTPDVSLDEALAGATSAENCTPLDVVRPTEDDLIGVNENVFAVKGTSDTNVKLLEYYPDEVNNNALTQKEVADALAAFTGKTFDKAEVKIADGKATASDGTVYTFEKGAVPERAWKITYPGGEAYGNATTPAKVNNVTSGIKYLVRDNAAAATNVEPVKAVDGVFTLESTSADLVYVASLELITPVTSGIIIGKVDDSEENSNLLVAKLRANNSLTELESANHKYIKAGTELNITAVSALEDGETIELLMNGEVAATITSESPETGVKVPVKGDNKGELKLTARKTTVPENIKIFVNDEEQTIAEGQTTITITGTPNAWIVKKNPDTEVFEKLAGNPKIESDGALIMAVNTLKALKVEGSDEVRVWTAFSVNDNGAAWTAYKDSACAEAIGDDELLPVDTTIYVQSVSKLLAANGQHTELEGKVAGEQANVTERTFTYPHTLKSDLTSASFTALVTFTASADNSTNVIILNGTDKVTVPVEDTVITVADKDAKPTFEVKSFAAKDPAKDALIKTGLKASDFTVSGGTEGADATKLHVSVKPTAGVRASTAETPEVYTLTVLVGGVEVPIDLTFAKRTEMVPQDYILTATSAKLLGSDYKAEYKGNNSTTNTVEISGSIRNFNDMAEADAVATLKSWSGTADGSTVRNFMATYQRTWEKLESETHAWEYKFSDQNGTAVEGATGLGPNGEKPLDWSKGWGFVVIKTLGDESENTEISQGLLVAYDGDKVRFVLRGRGTTVEGGQGWICEFVDSMEIVAGKDGDKVTYTVRIADNGAGLEIK